MSRSVLSSLRLVVLDPIKHMLQKHSTKSVCLGSLNKGSNCERKILSYKKNKLSMPYQYSRSVLLDIKLLHLTLYRCFDRLLGS